MADAIWQRTVVETRATDRVGQYNSEAPGHFCHYRSLGYSGLNTEEYIIFEYTCAGKLGTARRQRSA